MTQVQPNREELSHKMNTDGAGSNVLQKNHPSADSHSPFYSLRLTWSRNNTFEQSQKREKLWKPELSQIQGKEVIKVNSLTYKEVVMKRVKERDKKIWMISKWMLVGIFAVCLLGVPPVLAQLVPAVQYFVLELDGGVTANLGTPEVSILRAQCREDVDGILLDVDGAAHDPANAVVTISDTNNPLTVFGTATAVPDLANPLIGVYAFQLENNLTFTVCPSSVTASNTGAQAVAAVDVRAAAIPVAGPIELEGPISAVVDNGDGTGNITVMGITVVIPAAAAINSPTAALTLAQLADPTPLPGRSSPGFVGGTAIIIGQMNGVTPTADDVFVEPAENVVLGPITAATCTNADCSNPGDSLQVLGVPLSRLTDPRIPAKPPVNAFGFQVDMTQGVLVGSLAAVEGYFSQRTNSAPTITSVPVTTATVGVLYTYDVNATDPDVGDTITFSLITAPAGMTINATTGVISWTPTAGQLGPNPVTVRATDSGALFGEQSFIVTVGAPPVNNPPVANPDSFTATANVLTPLSVLANDTDPDGPADIVAVANLTQPTPAGASVALQPDNRTVNFTATAAGTYTFTYQARDAAGALSNTATVTVTVGAQGGATVSITRALYIGGSRYRVEGTSTPAAVRTITLQVLNGATVVRTDTITSRADGRWLIDRLGVALPNVPLTVRATTSTGAVATAPLVRQ